MNAQILLAMPSQRRDRLLHLLGHHGLNVSLASTSMEARQKLMAPHTYELPLVDAELPDGSWRDLIPLLVSSNPPCEMVVCSRTGDERLWAEVIQCGAFDLISEPYEQQEVIRIIQSALEGQYMRQFRRQAQARAS